MNLNTLFQWLKSSFLLYCSVSLSALTLEDVVTTRTNLALFFELIPRVYFWLACPHTKTDTDSVSTPVFFQLV